MNKEKVRAIVAHVIRGTNSKTLKWTNAGDDDFALDFPGSSVSIGYDEEGELALSFFNGDGVNILSLGAWNIGEFGFTPEVIKDLHTKAKNQVFKFDETFDDILNNLKGS